MIRSHLATLVLAVSLLTGCSWFKKNPRTQAPPAPAPKAQPTAAPTKPVTPQPKKTAVKPRRTAPARQQTTAPPPLPEVEPKAPSEAPSVQQLGNILSAEEKDKYRSMYEQSWVAAREMLAALSGRALNSDQRDSAGRIRSFLKQAQETGSSDWSAAAQLARRAELLARDLLRAFQ